MGFEEGQIVFDREDLTYYAGQLVSGRLVFDLTNTKSFRGLYMKMKGECHVHWSTKHTRRVNERTEHYTVDHNAHEDYYEQKVFLMGGTEGEVHLQPGHYELPFQCMIPQHCPSSYEGSNGNIRYTFRAVVDRSFKFDQEKCRNITVINQRDLNRDPYCKKPMEFEFEESYCCCCMSSGTCDVKVKLPQSGYCPGQTIRVELGVANKSNVEVDEIKFEVMEHRDFRATHEPDTRHETHLIARLKKGPIPGETTRNWTVEMDIPQMDVYNVDACQYIDIYHTFEVSISASGCHTDTEAFRRIVLGHVPLRDFEEDSQSQSDQIIAQPVAPTMSQYPGNGYPGTQPFPNQPYPGNTYSPGYPGGNPAFPGANPYPGNQPQPSPFPSPYPGATPYPGNPMPGVAPYPGGNSNQLPGVSPFPVGSDPVPPYPSNPGMPGGAPYPVGNAPFLPMMQPGFKVGDPAQVPLLPPTAAVPYPTTTPVVSSPYVQASAPEPSTPDADGKKEQL